MPSPCRFHIGFSARWRRTISPPSDRIFMLSLCLTEEALSLPDDTPIEHVCFVQDGMVSLVQPLENGAMIEVGMIGNEGLVGSASLAWRRNFTA